MVGDSGELVEHEITGETGPHGLFDELNNHLLVWFEMVLLNHSSRIIFITSLIMVKTYYYGILCLIKCISNWKLVMLFSIKYEC